MEVKELTDMHLIMFALYELINATIFNYSHANTASNIKNELAKRMEEK